MRRDRGRPGPEDPAMSSDLTPPRKLPQDTERFRSFLEGVKDYAIFMTDPDGRVVSWNAGAERVLGYPAQEVIGRHVALFGTPEQARDGAPPPELRQAARDGFCEQERWHVRKDGTRFWAHELVTALRDENGDIDGYAQVMRDITDRKQLEEELRRQAEELAEANRRKDEFLAMLSHELRNPLAPILNSVHVIRQVKADHPVLRQAGNMIERQVRHLARLIDDLLEVTRITRGKIVLHRARVDLNPLARRAAESTQQLMQERRHELEVALSPAPVWVEADPTRIDQILVNLLNNAAKYTDAGGRITLAVAREGDEAVVRVRDTGIGIAADMLPRIFDLFAQADNSLARSRGGLGIGLALVRNLVQMHGGVIEARSEGLGRGCEFVVRLPALPQREAQAAADVSAPGVTRPLRMLVVDDNTDSADSLGMLLKLHGHEVRVEYSGPAALQAAEAGPFDVILLDIGLPRMDGYEVARRLRARPDGKRPTLVAVTGYGYEADRQRSQEAGFDHHLVKPVGPERLEELLQTLNTRPSAERG